MVGLDWSTGMSDSNTLLFHSIKNTYLLEGIPRQKTGVSQTSQNPSYPSRLFKTPHQLGL